VIPRTFGAVHPRFHTPHRAIVLQAAWGCVLVLTGSYRVLVARVVYTEWIFFALMAIGLLLLRRRDGFTAAYRAPLGRLLPLGFAAAALLVAANQVAAAPVESVTGLLLVATGLPVYLLWARRGLIPSRLIADGD
jgi:APA family basic amino acid/polyamine antiporter